jgi:hypothetical protein
MTLRQCYFGFAAARPSGRTGRRPTTQVGLRATSPVTTIDPIARTNFMP